MVFCQIGRLTTMTLLREYSTDDCFSSTQARHAESRDSMSMETIWAPWRLAYIAPPEAGQQSESAPSVHSSGPEIAGAKGPQTDEQPESSAAAEEACFLCRYRDASPEQDRENLVLHRGRTAFVVFNRYPYNNGHMLVAPYAHLGDLTEIPPEVQAECQELLKQLVQLLRNTMNPDGFNIGLNLGRVAGAGLPGHLHWHIVPRWNGDTNFMPVLADTKVIPQSLAALYDLLKPRWPQDG